MKLMVASSISRSVIWSSKSQLYGEFSSYKASGRFKSDGPNFIVSNLKITVSNRKLTVSNRKLTGSLPWVTGSLVAYWLLTVSFRLLMVTFRLLTVSWMSLGAPDRALAAWRAGGGRRGGPQHLFFQRPTVSHCSAYFDLYFHFIPERQSWQQPSLI